jgi:hypothetical protein
LGRILLDVARERSAAVKQTLHTAAASAQS